MSRLCERCVLAVNNISKQGIKINKIFYSNENGELTSTTPTKLLNRTDHHVSKYFKNNNYKPTLSCCDDSDHSCHSHDSEDSEESEESEAA